MSVQHNTYVIRGAIYPFPMDYDNDSKYEKLEPYMDNAFKGIHHHDGICILYDGMNGKYVILGRVDVKSDVYEGFDAPIVFPAPIPEEDEELKTKIEAIMGEPLPAPIEWIVVTHYR